MKMLRKNSHHTKKVKLEDWGNESSGESEVSETRSVGLNVY